MIDIKSPPEDLFGMNVESIVSYTEDDENYVNPPEKFEYFHIDYLDEDLLKASVERAEIGILVFKGMHKDLKKGQNELKEGQKDVIKGQKDVREEQKSMHHDMNLSFDRLDEKYGEFAKKMDSMDKSIKEMKDLFAKLVNHIVKE